MKILIATDSFKESLSAIQAARAIARGIQSVMPDAELCLTPVADGGEGTTEALVLATKGEYFKSIVTDPMGHMRSVEWGVLGSCNTAIIETAAASGLALVPIEERDPRVATSKGTGELIKAALDHGVRHIIIGLGGSATNDAGAGILQALGARLLDDHGADIASGASGLMQLRSIDLSGLDPRLAETTFEVACDVDNPLIGKQGASFVFGPQKGATASAVIELDESLANFADVVEHTTGIDIRNIPGAGAAGGIGGALIAFCNSKLRSGIDIVLDSIDFDTKLSGADLVLTGEGRIDNQTIRGKTPVGVSRRAKSKGIPVIALAGSVSQDSHCVHDFGIDALFSIVPGVVSLQEALSEAENNLCRAGRNIAALIKLDLKR